MFWSCFPDNFQMQYYCTPILFLRDSLGCHFSVTVCARTGQLLLAFLFSLQNEMCLATQQLSKQLLAYEKQVDDIYAVCSAVLRTLFSGTLKSSSPEASVRDRLSSLPPSLVTSPLPSSFFFFPHTPCPFFSFFSCPFLSPDEF